MLETVYRRLPICRAGMSITILIADDHELGRTGFRLFLDTQDDREVVGEAGDGERARELLV
jgi:DNA-binding NarL/FixJ family response regulator